MRLRSTWDFKGNHENFETHHDGTAGDSFDQSGIRVLR